MSNLNEYLLETTEGITDPNKIYKDIRDDHFEDYEDQIAPANFDLKVRKEMKDLAFLCTNPAQALEKRNRHAVTIRLAGIKQNTYEDTHKELNFTDEEPKTPTQRAILRNINGDVIQRNESGIEEIEFYLNRIDDKHNKWINDYSQLFDSCSDIDVLSDIIENVCVTTIEFLTTIIDKCSNKNKVKVLLEALLTKVSK